MSQRPRGLLVAILILLGGATAAAENANNAATAAGGLATATFAGGCFWCMEPPFDKLDGVKSTISGYTGGNQANPTYEQVSAGGTGHVEAVRIVYDPTKLSYEQLLSVYWHNIDPLDAGGAFCDRGDQYHSAIFYHTAEQKRLAETSKKQLAASGRFDNPIVTQVVAAGAFYPAETYHQDYYQKNPIRYKTYRFLCGRDKRLQMLWGDPNQAGAG
nr:peptide-methionine (S)-S-oxide reductase MsrA [Nitrococcus mobilis]